MSVDPAVAVIIEGADAKTQRRTTPLAEALACDIEAIDWPTFWSTDPAPEEWVIEPIVPARRQVATYSPAKSGKSLLVLDGVAALATGRSVFGQEARALRSVVYMDLEMTEDDVRERLIDLGYGPDDDLSRLHYYQLPSLPSLDSERGGQVLEAIVRRDCADLVVIDTMARVVDGDEDDADTYRNFYARSGIRLKRLGVALWRLDHAGKDLTRGQRGSSGKADDVDVVFRFSVSEDKVVLTRTHSRIPWVPQEIAFRRETDPLLRHVLTDGGWPAGTKEIADLLDELEVPLDATVRMANEAIKRGTGKGRRIQLVTAGLKFQRVRNGSGNTPGNTILQSRRETHGSGFEGRTSPQVNDRETFPGNSGKQTPSTTGNVFPSLEGNIPVPTDEDFLDEDDEVF